MSERVPLRMRLAVQDRARNRCEYCCIHEEDTFFPHQPDHIIATKHGGLTELDNLAWSCVLCNSHKGSDIASIDPATGRIEGLFHPRRNHWSDHFVIQGSAISGLTGAGRVTVTLLQLNATEHVKIRHWLRLADRWPGELPSL